MRHLALPLLVLVLSTAAQGQVRNGGFEELSDQGLPAYWQGNLVLIPVWIDSAGVAHSDSVVFEDANYRLTTDVHSGDRAIELGNGYNFTQGLSIPGSWSASSDSAAYGGFPLVLVPVGERPSSISFFAKFLPVQGDVGHVKVTVFDEGTNEVGAGELLIDGTYSTYTPFDVPVTYATLDQPAFLSVTFSTARPDAQATLGTRFLIDDVELRTATGVVEHRAAAPLSLYPAPAQDIFALQAPGGLAVRSMQVVDALGREQRVARLADGTYGCGHLPDGSYVVRVRTDQGPSIGRLLVQH